MNVLLLSLWPGLAAALVLGLAIGALTGVPRARPTLVAATLSLLALGALTGLAMTGTVAGRAGLWIEIAALFLAVYLVGCGTGAVGRTLVRHESIIPNGGIRPSGKNDADTTT